MPAKNDDRNIMEKSQVRCGGTAASIHEGTAILTFPFNNRLIPQWLVHNTYLVLMPNKELN